LDRAGQRRHDERDEVLALGAVRARTRHQRQLGDRLAATTLERSLERSLTAGIAVTSHAPGGVAHELDLGRAEAGLLDELLRDGVEGAVEIEVAVNQVVHRVRGAQLRRLAVELGPRVLELLVSIEQGLVGFLELTGRGAGGEGPGERAPDPSEEWRLG